MFVFENRIGRRNIPVLNRSQGSYAEVSGSAEIGIESANYETEFKNMREPQDDII